MKSLEKERSRRYETANGLARDLQRYLADEVVEARPPSTGYRLRKFVRRNRGLVVAVGLDRARADRRHCRDDVGDDPGREPAAEARPKGSDSPSSTPRSKRSRPSPLPPPSEPPTSAHSRSNRNDKRNTRRAWWVNSSRPRSAKCRELSRKSRKTVAGPIRCFGRKTLWLPSKSDKKLRLALALLPVDQSKIEDLRDGLLRVSPSEFLVVRDALLPYKEGVLESLWNAALDPNLEAQKRFQAASALATYAPEDRTMEPAQHVRGRSSGDSGDFGPRCLARGSAPAKGPTRSNLSLPYFRDKNQDTLSRRFATETLADYLSDRPDELFNLLADSERFQFVVCV